MSLRCKWRAQLDHPKYEHMNLTINVPTFNAAPTTEELVSRIEAGVGDPSDGEIVFVDDASDDTPNAFPRVIHEHEIEVRLTVAMFLIRWRNCSDTITGFFAVRPDTIVIDHLQPRGLRILLEILAHSVAFNGAAAALRVPLLWVIVEFTPILPHTSQMLTPTISFMTQLLFPSRVVCRPLSTTTASLTPGEAELSEMIARSESEN